MKTLHIISAGVFLISVILAGVFFEYPLIDLVVSGQFYDAQKKVFPLAWNNNNIWNNLHNSTPYIVYFLVGLMFVVAAVSWRRRRVCGISFLASIYVLVALAVGPGLLVNSVFKENWGRARPSQIEQFGGDKAFSQPWVISDQCEGNCSFVSGDPSVGFVFVALAFVFGRRAPWFFIVPLTLGSALGAARVVLGAHFLSDVLFSGAVTYLSSYILFLGYRRVAKRYPALDGKRT